jgi:hypothetical protein
MPKIILSHHLKERIRQLEEQKEAELLLTKIQFQALVETVKPKNLIKHSIAGIYNSSIDKTIIITGLTSLVVGFITKKLVVRKSSNAVKKMFGNLVQYLVPLAVSTVAKFKSKAN